jgi:MFS family permease
MILAAILVSINLFLVTQMPKAGSNPTESDISYSAEHSNLQGISSAFARLSWIANLAGTFAISMIIHLFPRLAVDLSVPADYHGSMLAGARLVTIATYLLMHHSHFWHYRFSTSLVAQFIAVGGLALLIVADTIPELALALAAISLLGGYNYFASIYYSSTGGTDEKRGFASGMHEATLGVGIAAGSFFGGLFGTFSGKRGPYILALAVFLFLIAVQIIIYLRHVRPLLHGKQKLEIG